MKQLYPNKTPVIVFGKYKGHVLPGNHYGDEQVLVTWKNEGTTYVSYVLASEVKERK